MAKEVLAEAVPEFDAVIHLTWCPKPVVEYFLTQVYCLEDSLQANCDWGLLRDLLKALKVLKVCFLLAPKTNFGPNSSTNLAVLSDRKKRYQLILMGSLGGILPYFPCVSLVSTV